MTESKLTLDIETLVDRARALWHKALIGETRARVELFAKVSLRSKVARDLEGGGAKLDHVHETGLAVRVMRAGYDYAGFASASGLSDEVVRWALDTACSFGAQAPVSAPGPSDVVAAERWDLDAETELPVEDALRSGVVSRPSLEWIEAGTTLEVLIGAEGWIAARRRHRVWALEGGLGARLIAQRGFTGWEHLLDGACGADSFGGHSDSEDLGVLALTPDASSSVVEALVETFHGAGTVHSTRPGHGWDIADEPNRPEGLAGGSFDDAGFPTASRILAADGLWMGTLGGPGSFRRASFREPPTESATNLVMASGETSSIPDGAAVARRCRVLRLSSELWVLELDVKCGTGPSGWARRWVRVRPQDLLEACVSRLGGSKVTPNGPIVPVLLFEGLSATLGD